MSEARIAEFAPAKVNLWLRITGRRDDLYHLLDSLVVFADVGDVVRAAPADALSLTVEGPFAAFVPAGEDNLVLRAARACGEPSPPGRGQGEGAGASIHLTKNLPPASGIGGGSSDAAATLRALARLWVLDPAIAERVAPALGADVPACLRARPCRMQDIGDQLDDVAPLPRCGIVLANPKIPLETRAVFAARTAPFSTPFPPAAWANAQALAADIRTAGNDLRAPAISLCPTITDVLRALETLPGALCAEMSGSGASCFALFATPEAAELAAHALPADWWRWGGALATAGAPSAAPPRRPFA